MSADLPLDIKICGLSEPERLVQAAGLGARFAGIIFYPPSPRFVPPERAADLVDAASESGIESVGVVVDASDAFIDHVLACAPVDWLQLHGYESPARAAEIGLRTGCRIIKALRVEGRADLEPAAAFDEAADILLFDAKPPREAGWPGGHGLPFDWRVLEGFSRPGPWALAGGLAAANLEAAWTLLSPPMVDVSSGVESAPGIKDAARLEEFFKVAGKLARDAGDA